MDQLLLTSRIDAPTTPDAWARQTATIVHPVLGRVPFNPYPYQSEFLAGYHAPRRIVLKARQIGYSQTFALEALYAAITEPDTTILLVSRSQDLAINLLRYCYITYNALRGNVPALEKENESEIGLSNGSRIKSIPANRSTGRGFAATRVYLDEFAYASYAEDIYQSVSPAVSRGGCLVVGSTPNGIGNLFHELYSSADGWERQRVPWHACPAYYTDAERAAGVPPEQSVWYQRERPKYTARQWASEYECDFVGSGDAVFSAADIDAAEADAVGAQAPVSGRDYMTSVDIGRRQDATVINTFDITRRPYQRVAHQRFEGLPYPLIQQHIERRWQSYGGELHIESNGIGDPVIENLAVPVKPFVTTAKSKLRGIQALQLLLEQRALKARWTPQERKEFTLYKWDDRDITQDCVMSLAIGAARMAESDQSVSFVTRYR